MPPCDTPILTGDPPPSERPISMRRFGRLSNGKRDTRSARRGWERCPQLFSNYAKWDMENKPRRYPRQADKVFTMHLIAACGSTQRGPIQSNQTRITEPIRFQRSSLQSRSQRSKLAPGATGARETCYLGAAQAYILISMPTGTSTIFGHFQAIRELPIRGTIAE